MGKKSHKGAKNILKQIEEANKQIAESTAEMIMLQAEKGKILAKMCLAEGDEMTHGAAGGSGPRPPYQPRRTVAIGDILNPDQLQAVVDVLNRQDIDDIQQTKLLKTYLGQYKKQFSLIGMNPEFIAYVLIANKANLIQLARNSAPEDPFQPGPNSQN